MFDYMRRLLFRFLLWCYNVCPEHGPKELRCSPGGCWYACAGCDETWQNRRDAKIRKLRAEVGR